MHLEEEKERCISLRYSFLRFVRTIFDLTILYPFSFFYSQIMKIRPSPQLHIFAFKCQNLPYLHQFLRWYRRCTFSCYFEQICIIFGAILSTFIKKCKFEGTAPSNGAIWDELSGQKKHQGIKSAISFLVRYRRTYVLKKSI